MSRRQRSRPEAVEVVRLLGVVGLGRRRGLRVAVVEQGGRQAVEIRNVALSPAASVAPRDHRSILPLDALPAVVALLAGVKREGGK